jgi:hypothetical protein
MRLREHHEMVERIREVIDRGDFEEFTRAQWEASAADAVQEWPQSGERIRGRDNIRAVAENYPTGPRGLKPEMTLRRILEPCQAYVLESVIDYGDGVPVSLVSIIETSAGRIVRETDYFAYPFAPPDWRKPWVELMYREPVRIG